MKAFTLVELLVVIAIISVLAAVLLPSLDSVREHGRVVACLANQQILFLGQQYYVKDNGVYAPYWWTGAPAIYKVQGYISSESLCSSSGPTGSPVNRAPNACPSIPVAIKGVGGNTFPQGWNSRLGGYFYRSNGIEPPTPDYAFVRPHKILHPSKVPGWAEVKGHGVFYPPSTGWAWSCGACIELRHGTGIDEFSNCAFMDGHGGRVDEEDRLSNAFYNPLQ